MKKYIYILTTLLLGAVSCSVDGPAIPDVNEKDGKVEFIMKVTLPEPIIVTKGAMDDQPVIDNLYVAVFGGEGYLNDYTRAVRCDANGENLSQDWSGITNGMNFYFKVTLTATQSLRHVHVIANGPDQLDFNTYENELMQHLVTSDDEGAYWQYFELPNGTVMADGETPSAEAAAAFSHIRLIRNFAKVSVTVDTDKVKNFTLTGFNVYNTTTAGSVAIWDGSKYVTGYENYSTIEALSADYPPFVPEEAGYNSAKPKTDETYDTSDKFIYERPVGAEDRPYIILRGRYTGDMMDTYYRLDFVTRDGDYLPIYRNFEYKVILTSVAKSGVTDPATAKASNANVSSITETANLSDLADGVSRIYVMWLDQTYMAAQNNVAFKYMYLQDAANDTESTAATFSVISNSEAGAAITPGAGWNDGGTLGSDGWRTVYFNVQAPNVQGGAEKTTTFRVTGETTDHQKLYRNITIHVLPTQSFGTATVTSAGAAIGSKVTVSMSLPAGLPSSIFPLQILFEDSNKNLNPYGNDMPVNVGPTIVGNGTGTSYQFNKSISWTEYMDNTTKVFAFEFKRIKTGATTLYYSNQYFNKGNTTIGAN